MWFFFFSISALYFFNFLLIDDERSESSEFIAQSFWNRKFLVHVIHDFQRYIILAQVNTVQGGVCFD